MYKGKFRKWEINASTEIVHYASSKKMFHEFQSHFGPNTLKEVLRKKINYECKG